MSIRYSQGLSIRKVDVMYPSDCRLGESPIWDEERESCFWVDIEGCSVYEYPWNGGRVLHYYFDQRVSLIVPGKKGKLIMGVQGGIAKFSPDTKKIIPVSDMGVDWRTHRCNDGACDVKGRLWIGTMELNGAKAEGALYCLDKKKQPVKKLSELSIANGIAWSVDNKRVYHIDSVRRDVRSYLFEEEQGNIVFEKAVVKITKKRAFPDGMAMDEEGMLWVALWGGFGVGRFNPDSGKMISFVDVPVPHVTSCAFVGKQLDTLIITTAKQGLTGAELSSYPLSGHVFIVEPGVKGQPRYRCGL